MNFRILGIMAFLLVMLVSNASAETIIDSISTDPNPPTYKYSGSGPVDELYIASFIINVHVTNPPVGGSVSYSIGAMDQYSGYATIDNNGVAKLPASIHQGFFSDGRPAFSEPTTLYLLIYDANGNVVASAEKFIKILWIPSITWNNPDHISSVTPLSSTHLNAVASDPGTGNNIPGTFVYTPAEGTVLSEGTQTLHVEFTPADTENYITASKDVIIEAWNPVPYIQDMANYVHTLGTSDGLSKGQTNALIAKLDTAIKNLNAGDTAGAIDELNAFISRVNVYIENGKISSPEWQYMISAANFVIDELSTK